MSTDQEMQPRGSRPRLTPEARALLREALAKGYEQTGDERAPSIRDLAAEHGRSFGLARTLLLEAGVKLRPARGGRKSRKAASQ